MSDYNSSLPIRTENAGDAVVKICDATVTSQQWEINASGEGLVKINAALPAGTNVIGHVIVDSGSITVSATDLDIRDLAFATDKVDVSGSSVSISGNVNVTQGTSPWVVSGTVDIGSAPGWFAEDSAHSSGAIGSFILAVRNDSNAVLTSADGDYSPIAVSSTGAVKVGVNYSQTNGGSLPTQQAVIAGYDGSNVRAIKTDSAGELQVDVLSLPAITATDLDIRNLDYSQDNVAIKGSTGNQLAVNADGSLNVNISDTAGDEIHDYNTASAIAAAAASNHIYTVSAGKSLSMYGVYGTASGKMKMEIQVETGVGTNSYNTKFVGFNSAANPDMDKQWKVPLVVAAGVRVRIIRTNKDNQAQDLYSTIVGVEV